VDIMVSCWGVNPGERQPFAGCATEAANWRRTGPELEMTEP
jgi:hypothetical protein